MEKAFKKHIKDKVSEFLASQGGWRTASPPKGNFITGKGPLWKKQGQHGATVFLFCEFHENLSAVEAYLGWNVQSEFPSIDAVMENKQTHFLDCSLGHAEEAALAVARKAPQGWFRQSFLGLADSFGLTIAVPPMERLATVFENPANRREIEVGLLGSPDVDWRQAKAFHYWGIIQHFDTLTAEDAELAVGGTSEQLIDVLKTYYLPIADRFLQGP